MTCEQDTGLGFPVALLTGLASKTSPTGWWILESVLSVLQSDGISSSGGSSRLMIMKRYIDSNHNEPFLVLCSYSNFV